MPLYEFDCEDCGRFEATRPIERAAAPLRCPSCGRSAPRVLSAVAIGHRARAPAGTPKRVVRRADAQPAAGTGGHADGTHGRPWMIGH